MKFKSPLLALCCLLAIWTGGPSGHLAAGEIGSVFEFRGEYSDNIYMNSLQFSDFKSELFGDVAYHHNQFGILLRSNVGMYKDASEYNYLNLDAEVSYFFRRRRRDTFKIRVAFSRHQYRDIFSDFNYHGPSIDFRSKMFVSDRSYFSGGYRFEKRDYDQFQSYSYDHHRVFISFKQFLASRTSIQFHTELNHRLNPRVLDAMVFEGPAAYFQNRCRLGEISTGGDGSNGQHGQEGAAVAGRLHRFSTSNLGLRFHIEQDLGTRMGIEVSASLRYLLNQIEETEIAMVNAFTLSFENSDHFQRGSQIAVILNAVLFKRLSLSLQFSYQVYRIPGLLVLDSEGNANLPEIERLDKRLSAILRIDTSMGPLDLSFQTSYRKNESNDPFFKYHVFRSFVSIIYGFGK